MLLGLVKKKIELNFKDHLDLICTNDDGDWDFYGMSHKISDKEFLQYPDADWNFNVLSSNCLITFSSVMHRQDKFWNWYSISFSKVIDKDVIDNNSLPFSRDGLTKNYNTSVYLLDHDSPSFTGKWCLMHISRVKCTNRFLLKNRNKYDFDYTALSYNKNIDMNSIIKLVDKPWCWLTISRDKTSDDYIINNPEIYWSIENLKENENVSKEIITQLNYYRKGLYGFSKNLLYN
jgi:hypothetical protein